MSGSDSPWDLTDHLCGACLGRVLVAPSAASGGRPLKYLCSNCGARGEAAAGQAHPSICACGMKVGNRDAGIRCVKNPNPRPEMPGEIVVREMSPAR